MARLACLSHHLTFSPIFYKMSYNSSSPLKVPLYLTVRMYNSTKPIRHYACYKELYKRYNHLVSPFTVKYMYSTNPISKRRNGQNKVVLPCRICTNICMFDTIDKMSLVPVPEDHVKAYLFSWCINNKTMIFWYRPLNVFLFPSPSQIHAIRRVSPSCRPSLQILSASPLTSFSLYRFCKPKTPDLSFDKSTWWDQETHPISNHEERSERKPPKKEGAHDDIKESSWPTLNFTNNGFPTQTYWLYRPPSWDLINAIMLLRETMMGET